MIINTITNSTALNASHKIVMRSSQRLFFFQSIRFIGVLSGSKVSVANYLYYDDLRFFSLSMTSFMNLAVACSRDRCLLARSSSVKMG